MVIDNTIGLNGIHRQNIQNGNRCAAGDVAHLPNDVFLLVISYLSFEDCIVCRRVSRAWLAAFSSDDVSWYLMKWHFPRSREMRTTTLSARRRDWAAIFADVARRYHHLQVAKPRVTEKLDVMAETPLNRSFRPVEPWNRFLRWNENTAIFQYRDPTWCLDDGLLICLDVEGRCIAYDLETRQRVIVPFDLSDKTVRRMRLAHFVLIVEWCEREPYHQLNDRETVHRHFATAFDVQRWTSRSSSTSPKFSVVRSDSGSNACTITFRSEWKIHFLGLPVNRHDRFFSVHNSTYYALYLWQPNRSPWGEEEPLEQLIVWNISFPSSYRPSLDPTGAHKPDADLGPRVTQRLTWRELDFYGLRQRHTPAIRELLLDDSNVYIHEEEHRWLSGGHSSFSPPRHHLVRCTGIPMSIGPRWVDECCADGDVHMSFCPRSGSAAGSADSTASSPYRSMWPGLTPCWRHEEFPYLTVSDVVDAAAGVRIVARQCFMMEALSTFVLPRISTEIEGQEDESAEVRFADDMWAQLMAKGKICGDERWVVGEDGEGRITIVRF